MLLGARCSTGVILATALNLHMDLKNDRIRQVQIGSCSNDFCLVFGSRCLENDKVGSSTWVILGSLTDGRLQKEVRWYCLGVLHMWLSFEDWTCENKCSFSLRLDQEPPSAANGLSVGCTRLRFPELQAYGSFRASPEFLIHQLTHWRLFFVVHMESFRFAGGLDYVQAMRGRWKPL